MKTIKIRLLTLWTLSALLVACGNDSNGNKAPVEQPSKQVQTSPVKKIDYQETIFASGQLSSSEEAKLSFKTGGIIQKIHVREGQVVRKGQLLAELDLDEIKAQTQQAELGREQSQINIRNAELALEIAERDYTNTLGLYKDSVATLEQMENVEVQLKNAKNQLEAAKKGLDFNDQNVEVAQFNLKYSRIIAPTNGTILKKLAENNELVGPGTPVFLFGSKDNSQVIKVSLTDKDIIHVELDDEAEVQFDAYPNTVFKGNVREVASMADPYTNTYEVEVEVFRGDKRLLSGFIGTVIIFSGNHKDLLEIPIDALLSADENRGEVFVVDSGRAIKTQVSIFKIKDTNLLIESGLNEADEVITSGVGYIEDEEPVMISQK